MRRALLGGILGLVLLAARAPHAAASVDRLWFAPDAGTLDYVDLFQDPSAWSHARQLVDVFKFYQQHTLNPPDPIVGPNSYDALVRAGAFSTLTQWHKKIAIEVGAVKPQYCTPDASGMQAAVADTLQSMANVSAAGGTVTYLAMDEPFVSGRDAVCGGPALEPTADRVITYVKGVHASMPTVQIGLIEAYPFSSAGTLEQILALLKTGGYVPAFLHMDVDMAAASRIHADVTADLRRLRDVCRGAGITFGVIIWGENGDADALYALDAERLLNAVTTAFPTWDDLPEQIVVQSWAASASGLRITPINLPESSPWTHTSLLWSYYRRLRGATGPTTDTAVVRR